MYLDHSPTNHRRFAAYEIDMGGSASGDMPQTAARVQDLANYYERYFGLQEQELQARMSQAARSSADARRSLNAQMKAEAARLQLARDQMEKIGIPTLQLQQWTAAKQNEIAQLGVQLDYLNAYSQYQSNPDMYWVARSFKGGFQNLANSAQGLDPFRYAEQGGQMQDRSTQPQPQSMQSLVADLTGGSGAGAATVDQQNAQAAAQASGGGTPGTNQYNPGGNNPAAGGNDPIAAINTLTRSSPPSPYDGLNADDAATLHNIASIYAQPGGLASLPLNSLEGMDPAQRSLLLGGGRRLGRLNSSDLYNYANSRWSNGSAQAA